MSDASCLLRRPTQPLTDGIVTLDSFTRGDVREIVGAIDDEILRWLPLPDPYGESEAREFVDAPPNVAVAGDALNFAIRLAADNTNPGARMAGSIGLSVSRACGGEVQLGYWIAPAARGRGTAGRAVRLLAAHALASAEVDRLLILTHPDNHASRRVAERSGARFEGVRRGGLDPPARDGTTDAAVYVLTRPPA